LKSKSFKPIARADARVLILGSLPGRVSLEQQRYYAQPYNAFWRIMGDLVGASPDVPYQERLALLRENRIAVWDVCAAAVRDGSLDSAIDLASIEANDFSGFLRKHPGIQQICFNGKKAQEIYTRKVHQEPRALFERIRYVPLPSSSAAHAGMPYLQKLSLWRDALAGHISIRVPTKPTTADLFKENETRSMVQGSPA
jgi:double-stranded uracil-DNA glycosylase